MNPIFWFEIRYRLKSTPTYIYALVFFLMGILIMSTDAVRIGGGYGKVLSNAPFNIHQIISIMGILGLFIIMAFHAVPIFRDFEHRVDNYLYAYPISRLGYLNGRFWGTFVVCSAVYFFLPLGMMVGELIARANETSGDNWGPFSVASYAWPYLICSIPTIFLMGSMFFSLVTLTRKMMAAYLVAISFIVLYGVGLDLLSKLDNKMFAAVLDPFGLIASDKLTEYWSIAQKNQDLVPVMGHFLLNRIFWFLVGLGFFLTTLIRFTMVPAMEKGKAAGKQVKEEKETNLENQKTPSAQLLPSSRKIFLSLLRTELRLNFRNVFFLTFMFAIALFLAMGAWYADSLYETGIYPVTGNMIEDAISGNFFILTLALLIFMSGEVVWRERQFNMDGIYNAFPTQNGAIFFSKLASLLLIPFFELILVAVVCMAVQIIKGYYHLEPVLYAKTLLLFELPKLWLIAILAFSIQVLVNNKFLGHGLVVLYYISFVGLSYLHIEHPLFRFGGGMSYTYSDMNGFGEMVRGFQGYLLHWSLVSGFLLTLAYLGLVRGNEPALKTRWKNARRLLSQSPVLQGSIGLFFVGMMGSGFYIYYQTVVMDKFQNSKVREAREVAYEKKYGYLIRSAHPGMTKVKIGADMFPETNEAILTGDFQYVNQRDKAIDTLWFNFNPKYEIRKFNFSIGLKKVVEDKEIGQYAYKLDKPLAPGDSFQVKLEMYAGFTGFSNESPVRGNGTFFNNGEWPSVGFNENMQLEDEDKRKENGLPEIPPFPSPTDSVAIHRSLFDQKNHNIQFEAVLSTSPDQMAIAPGYLIREWTEKGRHYFHYKMDRPITNFYSIISARYATYKEKWNNVDITIFHHPWHSFNVKKMAEAVRHSLDYYTQNFGPYQHKQVRILEFPRYASFAQSFDNTIPYSEAIGFIANLSDDEAIDYVYFVTAHEMAHQWWGHQINPAYARGAQFLSETMAEYSALMVMRKRYGEALMGRFLRQELNRYLSGRSGEKKKENTLMDVEMQSYAYYSKGSLAMYKVMETITEQKINEFLKAFVSRYAFQWKPYPTTLDYYNVLKNYANGEELKRIDDQLWKITLYKNRITEAKGKKRPDGKYEVTIQYALGKVYADSLGKETEAPFEDPISVGLVNKETPIKADEIIQMETRRLPSGKPLVLISDKKPKYASLDVLHTYTDINMEDNIRLIDWE